MSRARKTLSEYKSVWLFAMFDLPVDSKEARREYTGFRKMLIKYGFSMMQYSIYARYFADEEASTAYRRRIRTLLPPEGQVRLVTITDRQFAKMEVFNAKTRTPPEKPPEQLMLF